jgi:hypothetical protein
MQLFTKVLFASLAAWWLLPASVFASSRLRQHHYGPPPIPPPGWVMQLPPDEADWLRFGYSGTRGRMGLGASPFHPEGPGNFSSPGR